MSDHKARQQRGQARGEKHQKQPRVSKRKTRVSGRKTTQYYKNKAPPGTFRFEGQGGVCGVIQPPPA